MAPLDRDTFFDGTHWAKWSAEYGCPNVEPNPFSGNAGQGTRIYCRNLGGSNQAKPESVQYRFCTLPEKNSDRPWIYSGAQPEFNQYPTSNKLLTTKWNGAFTKLGEMNALLDTKIPDSFNNATIYAGPSAQDEKLQYFKSVFETFGGASYDAREKIYNNPEEYSSRRLACDPRLEETAKICFEDAFNDAGVFTGTICTHINGFSGFDLATVRQRQIDSGSGDAIPASLGAKPTISLELKESIIANTVLLIESYIEDDLSAGLRTHIPEAYTFFRSNKRVCDPQCPVPSEWSPWTCHCSKSGLANPDNLVDCQCGNQRRRRIQTCTKVDGFSCEIYHEGLTRTNNIFDYSGAAANYETCAAYGYRNYLDNAYPLVYSEFSNGQNLKTVIDYLGDGTETSLMKWYPWPHADDQCIGRQVVSQAAFKEKLANPTSDSFTFAVEDDTCAATNVKMIFTDTDCTKTCGCGTKTRSYTCVYKGGDNDGEPVPKDDDDYKCGCEEKPDEVIACNIQCCPKWHQCDDRNCNANTAHTLFSPGINFKYEVCGQECGQESVEGELRCMCDNLCTLDYADSVIFESALAVVNANAPLYTEHDWTSCAANIKANTDGVFKNTADKAYRITRVKDCNHPCCVVTETNDNNCPTMDCNNDEFTLPWNIDYEKCEVSKLPRSSKQCVCDTTNNSKTKFCTDDDGVKYQKGDIFGADTTAPMCEYTRGEYISFNEQLSLINGKSDADPYYCCNEKNVQFLFKQWGEWGSCEIDGVTCGCVDAGNDNCGMQTRKRDLKCPEFKIDETHCPCVEVRKCHLPECPSGGPPKVTQSCKLSATKDDHYDYSVSQCSAAQSKHTLNYQNFYQLITSGTCEYCKCDEQVKTFKTTSVCTKFDTDCDGLIWQDWGECVLSEGSSCGVGSRSRLRKCGLYTTFDDVKNMCYDPWVKRNGGVGELATNLDYYQTEECYVQCPVWGPWTPCSAVPGGVGVQMRFETSNPANQDIRQCSISSTGPKEDEVHYGPCNAECGSGFRQKITYSFLGGAAIVTTEECNTGVACAPVASSCPGSTTPATIITKPTPQNGSGADVTFPQVPVDPVNPNQEVITAGVRALFGSIIAVILALMI